MRDAVICCPRRTPVGRLGGALASVGAGELAAVVVRAVVEASRIDPQRVDDVVLGQCHPNGEAPAIGRVAALDAGLPVTVPGAQVDRRCGSGLQAICYAAMQVQTGVADMVIAGGVENMSQVEFYALGLRTAPARGRVVLEDRLARARMTAGGSRHLLPGGMIETAENLRRSFAIGREEQDRLALESHRRAVAAQREGRFEAEVVPVAVRRSTDEHVVRVDEHPRPDTTLERLASLRPLMADVDAEATVTAGNSSGQNDAAAACLVTTLDIAKGLGVSPVARLLAWAVAGVEPEMMGLGPVPATRVALARAGLEMSQIDIIEMNEAFAVQVLACARLLGLRGGDLERLNVNGSGIALGHPLGATGARILVTLLFELQRRGARYGLETMCIGGGQGIAAVVERIEP